MVFRPFDMFRLPEYFKHVIRSWKNAATRKVWEGQWPRRFAGAERERVLFLLDALDAAPSLQAISPLKSLGLHKLKGARRTQWAMTANGRWRICFRFADGDAWDVELVDYHRG
jgi:proteic killer suppression protein